MNYSKNELSENLKQIHEKIREAEKRAGRQADSVRLLAVSKFHPLQSVLDAYNAGQTLFGENRVQEARNKFESINLSCPDILLHLIGTLQRNKVKDAVKIADCIESVDRIELLEDIEKQCTKYNRTIKILFEFHTGEESKSGFLSYESLEEAVAFCSDGGTPHIIPSGFMTMAPFTDDKNAVHSAFSLMRTTAEKLKTAYPQLPLSELSMGMSGDFEIAIEEGSTIVRIGTAIFGERDYTAT